MSDCNHFSISLHYSLLNCGKSLLIIPESLQKSPKTFFQTLARRILLRQLLPCPSVPKGSLLSSPTITLTCNHVLSITTHFSFQDFLSSFLPLTSLQTNPTCKLKSLSCIICGPDNRGSQSPDSIFLPFLKSSNYFHLLL